MSTLKRYSRLRPVSEKRRATEKDRAACLKAVRKRAGGKCEAKTRVCTGWGCEKLAPATDVANVLCHNYIHKYPALSWARGLVERRNK